MLDNSNMAKAGKKLGEIVRARLSELNRNPTEADEKGGLKQGFVNDLLIGRKSGVHVDNLAKLAKALDWSEDDLRRVSRGEAPAFNVMFSREKLLAYLAASYEYFYQEDPETAGEYAEVALAALEANESDAADSHGVPLQKSALSRVRLAGGLFEQARRSAKRPRNSSS